MEGTVEFFEAIKRGDAERVSALVGASPNLVRVAGEYGKTGLHWAAELDHIEVARVLVDAGADIEAKTSWGASPLEWASTMGGARVAELLLSRGAAGLTLIVAAGLGKQREVEAIVESGADLASHNLRAPRTPNDHWPADSAHILATVELLISRGANLSLRDERFRATAEDWAREGDHSEIVDMLRRRGASAGGSA